MYTKSKLNGRGGLLLTNVEPGWTLTGMDPLMWRVLTSSSPVAQRCLAVQTVTYRFQSHNCNLFGRM
jgi:hypothetical protein